MALSCFKAYDIRGAVGVELTEDVAYRIGRAYALLLNAKKVVIGHDMRLSSDSLSLALCTGLRDAGVDVFDLGLVGTEEVYFATSHLQLDGGIIVTASHNPKHFNGMKLVGKDARPVGADTGLREIERLVERNQFPPAAGSRGSYRRLSVLQQYIEHLLSYIQPTSLQPLKIVINVGNGAAGHVINALELRLSQAGVTTDWVVLHQEPDGNFPHGVPNPLLPECRQQTRDAVLQCKADLGVAFDGDFDRCFFFDHLGDFVEGYYMVGLLAETFLRKQTGQKIVHDPRLYWHTQELVQRFGGQAVQSKTGHAFMKETMRSENAVYGGEMSAHHYFRDFSYCDSGMIPWLLVYELISVQQKSLKAMLELARAAFPVSGEINLELSQPAESIERIALHYASLALHQDRTDGLSMEFGGWRFNLRMSNTESLVRLNVESKQSVDLMQEKTSELLSLLKSMV